MASCWRRIIRAARPRRAGRIGAGTRAFAPLLAASLIEDRLMTLDEPVALTIGDWGAHPVKSTISIRALLAARAASRSGARDQRDLGDRDRGSSRAIRQACEFSDDAASVSRVRRNRAAQTCEPSGREPDPARYLTTRTLLPIGCVPIGWTRDPEGAPRFDDWRGGFRARLGASGRTDPPRRRVARAAIGRRRRAARSGARLVCGSARGLWALARRAGAHARAGSASTAICGAASSPAPIDLAMAAGAGGQRLYLSPSEGVVIVAPGAHAGWTTRNGRTHNSCR